MSQTGRWITGAIVGAVIAVVAVGVCGKVVGAQEAPTPSTPAAPAATPSRTTSPQTTTGTLTQQAGYLVVDVIDGDTVRVRPTGSGGEQKVRLIGIDAPETGSCEASAATAALETLMLNRTVTLTMGGDGEDLDPYGRALRYVDTIDGDAGLSLINGGHAIARYDSRDGYGRHDRQDVYIAADAASPAYTCGQPSAATTEGTTRATTGATIREAPAAASYPNCSAARAAGAAPLYAGQPGYSSELDRDGDGIACE